MDLSLTLPIAEAKAAAKRLAQEVRLSLLARGGDLLKLFPEVGAAQRRRSRRAIEEDPAGLLTDGPMAVESTASASEAKADIDEMLRVMQSGSLTGEELFPRNEEADGDQGTTGRPTSPLT